ncbi:MAG: M23 family metallopeptidase [Armatimonadota bacterium]|nr:M23 family metallopeptidase [Armatimonadota bacterium]MDR5696776.1 M23 family metallopeptidase [Armatimonadota bacterium]
MAPALLTMAEHLTRGHILQKSVIVGSAALVLSLYAASAAGTLWLPVVGTVASGYGWRNDPFGEGWKHHWGLDIAARHGAPVAACAAGRVGYAGWAGGYGLVVVLAHEHDLQTLYAHLGTIRVDAGETVRGGQIIGTVGSTGRSTGPHLHFEVRHRNVPVDPIPYLRVR